MFGIAPSESATSVLTLPWCVVLGTAAMAAISDMRTGRIPNALTMPVFLAGLLWSAYAGGAVGLSTALANAILLAFPCLILFLFAGGGAGDVKLLGALGAWLGFHDTIVTMVCVAAAGVVCGIAYSFAQKRLVLLLANMHRILGSFAFAFTSRRVREGAALMPVEESMQPMPYGVAIAIGVWIAAGGRWLWEW